jgi:hypothetical protein
MNYIPRLALNLDPSNLSLPSSYDYSCEPLASNCMFFFAYIFAQRRICQGNENHTKFQLIPFLLCLQVIFLFQV